MSRPRDILLAFIIMAAAPLAPLRAADDPLASWNDGAAKQAIVAFVNDVTREGAATFVPLAQRIATFDNDGTLWAEQPMYFQLIFTLDRIKALAAHHHDWKNKEPFESVFTRRRNLQTLDRRRHEGRLEEGVCVSVGTRSDGR